VVAEADPPRTIDRVGVPPFRLRTLSRSPVFLLFTVLLHCLVRTPGAQAGDPASHPVGPILHQAEGLFRNMRAHDYPAIWALLSSKSRETIVHDVLKETAGMFRGRVEPEEIRRDFARGGAIARAYWEGYLEEFDPETALSESRWEMGEVGKDTAEIRITHKRSKRPAVLRMVREEGVWKVGLIETFRPRPLP